MLPELVQFGAASGHGQRFRADESSATNVMRRVADDNDFIAAQLPAQQAAAAFERSDRDLVAIFAVVGKATRLENLPKAIAAQFDFRAEADVAGKQAQLWRIGQGRQTINKLTRPVTGAAVALPDCLVEPENITLEEPLEIFRRRCNPVEAEKFAHQIHIRPPGKIDFFDAVEGVKFGREGPGKRFNAGATGVNERAVNVEQYESHHAKKLTVAAPTGNATVSAENKFYWTDV